MAQPQQLEFIAVGVNDAVRLTDSGMIDADQVERLPRLGAHDVRLFRRRPQDSRAEGKQALPVLQVIELIIRLPRALRAVIASDPQNAQFRSIQGYIRVHHGHWERVEPPPKTSFGKLVGSWVRASKSDEVLLEVTGAPHELSAIIAQIPIHVLDVFAAPTETAKAALPQEADAAAARRAELTKAWPSSADVARLLGRGAAHSNKGLGNSAQAAAVLRKAGRLLGVWVPAERGYRHPDCQFHEGAILPIIQPLLKLLPPGNGSGWSRAEWLYSPHALLNERRPAEVLATDPNRVLVAAQREYGEDSHVR